MLFNICLALCAALAIVGYFYGQALQAKEDLEKELQSTRVKLVDAERVLRVYRGSHRLTRDVSALRQAEATEAKTTPVPSIVPAWTND